MMVVLQIVGLAVVCGVLSFAASAGLALALDWFERRFGEVVATWIAVIAIVVGAVMVAAGVVLA